MSRCVDSLSLLRSNIQQDNETRLIVDYGFDETATVSLWQVRRSKPRDYAP